MVKMISTIIKPRFFSTISCLIWSLPLRRLNRSIVLCNGFFLTYGHVHVVGHDQHTGQEDCATDEADEVSRVRGFQDRKSTCLNSSHVRTSYAVFCLKNKD